MSETTGPLTGSPDPEVIARLRRAIQDGEYRVPASDVADAIISFFDRSDPEPPPTEPATDEEH